MEENMQKLQPEEVMVETAPEQPKKKISGAIIAIVAAVAIIAGATIGGMATGWYGLAGGPLSGLAMAANKTLSAENLTVEFEMDANVAGTDAGLSGEIKVAADADKQELIAWLDGKIDADETDMDVEALLADETLYALMSISMGGETVENAITQEVNLDELWDAYEEASKQEEID